MAQLKIINRNSRKVSVRSPYLPGGKALIEPNATFTAEMDRAEAEKISASIRNIPGIKTEITDTAGQTPASSVTDSPSRPANTGNNEEDDA